MSKEFARHGWLVLTELTKPDSWKRLCLGKARGKIM